MEPGRGRWAVDELLLLLARGGRAVAGRGVDDSVETREAGDQTRAAC